MLALAATLEQYLSHLALLKMTETDDTDPGTEVPKKLLRNTPSFGMPTTLFYVSALCMYCSLCTVVGVRETL